MATADQDLLFGLLALQNGLIDHAQLVAAFRAWEGQKGRSLAELLVAQGVLEQGQRKVIEALAGLHVAKHGDVTKSLAALQPGPSAIEHLAHAGLAEVEESLSRVGFGSADSDASTVSYQSTPGAGNGRRFRILRPHARGGLGAVHVALDEELHREVALKQILESHADDPASRQRFVVEAEITGGLEHPGIVPVYGLGTYPDGRPYYAMQLVKGESLKRTIERFHGTSLSPRLDGYGGWQPPAARRGVKGRVLELRQLLRRFIDVCNAIDYAHSRGVLHRDIKPGNVIVGRHGETVVLDWGLAKAVGKKAADISADEPVLKPPAASISLETQPGSALGTPAYMSPEQASGDLDALGPRSDVYSLGATLYSLLTGKRPFDGGGPAEVMRRVQNGNFPAPREVDPGLDRALEAICLKAMSLRPGDRYATPRALADDLERWEADEPVQALPEGLGRRLARWSRRNRAWVRSGAAALAVISSLTAGFAFLQFQSAGRERAARELAESRLGLLEKANELLVTVFQDLDPNGEAEGKTGLRGTLGDRLDKVAGTIGQTAEGDPRTVARLQERLGVSLMKLGYPDRAALVLEKAVRTLDASLGHHHPDTLSGRTELAHAYVNLGKFADAVPHLDSTLEARLSKLGPDHPETHANREALASALDALGRLDRSGKLYQEGLESARKSFGPGDGRTMASLAQVGKNLIRQNHAAEAEPVLRECLEHREGAEPGEPSTFETRSLLGEALAQQRKFEEAESLLVTGYEGLAAQKERLGPKRSSLLGDGARRVVRMYEAWGRPEEAAAWSARAGLTELPADVFSPRGR